MATVLVADDNRANRQALSALLESVGHRVIVASDGREALEKARAERPQLVISDVLMPLMDGYELARRLRAQLPVDAGLQLVAVTGYGLERDRQRSAEAGFTAHLVKPIELAMLEELLLRTTPRPDDGARPSAFL